MRRAAYLVVLGLGFATAGCPPPEADDRLDRADLGADGGRASVSVGGGKGGTAGAPGGSEGTGGASTQWPTTTLVADIQEINQLNTLPAFPSDPIVDSGSHSGQVDVVAQGRDDDTFVIAPAVEADVRLDGVRKSDGTWVRVATEQSDVMSMLHQVDTADSRGDMVYVIQRLLMDSILTQVNTGLSYEVGSAQVMVRVIDDQRDGVAGITVSAAGSEAVLYLELNSWVDLANETDESGLALIVNVGAKAIDGYAVPIVVGGAAVSVPVYPDTVTLVEVPAP